MNGVIELLSEGVGKLFALIVATFPEGSTCTCTDGDKIFKSKAGTTKWLCAIPYAATWTVTSEDKETGESASQGFEVLPEAQGQIFKVDLAYKDYVIHNGVLKDGYQIVIKNSSATCEVVDGAIEFRSTKSSGGNGSITINANGQAIDLSNRNYLYFDTEATSPRSGLDDVVQWGVSGASTVQKRLGVNNPVERQIVPIEVSNISSGSINLYIGDNWGTVPLRIYNAWFD
jgi:hypothetical protein